MANKISRRNFLKYTGASALFAALAQIAPQVTPAQETTIETISRVHIHTFDPHLTTAPDAVAAAMLAATDLSWLKAGDSVFIKVACNSNFAPPSVTSPDAVSGVVKALLDAGAGTVYVGDMSGAIFVRHLAEGGFGSTRDNMREVGLLQAAENAGATIHCFEEVPFEEAYIAGVPNGENHWEDDLYVAKILDEVDHIINLPRLGKHVLAGMTLGLKSAVGWISDHSRMVLHRDGDTFQKKIAEINAIPQIAGKTRLTLTLVDKLLTTYGPDNGYPLSLSNPMVIASEDVVSHDQIALITLLWGRRQTPAEYREADPYPAQSDGLNAWFVRTTWGQEAAADYTSVPTFENLATANGATHINYAYDVLNGGRPDRIEVVPGGEIDLDWVLADMFVADPNLRIVVNDKTV